MSKLTSKNIVQPITYSHTNSPTTSAEEKSSKNSVTDSGISYPFLPLSTTAEHPKAIMTSSTKSSSQHATSRRTTESTSDTNSQKTQTWSVQTTSPTATQVAEASSSGAVKTIEWNFSSRFAFSTTRMPKKIETTSIPKAYVTTSYDHNLVSTTQKPEYSTKQTAHPLSSEILAQQPISTNDHTLAVTFGVSFSVLLTANLLYIFHWLYRNGHLRFAWNKDDTYRVEFTQATPKWSQSCLTAFCLWPYKQDYIQYKENELQGNELGSECSFKYMYHKLCIASLYLMQNDMPTTMQCPPVHHLTRFNVL